MTIDTDLKEPPAQRAPAERVIVIPTYRRRVCDDDRDFERELGGYEDFEPEVYVPGDAIHG